MDIECPANPYPLVGWLSISAYLTLKFILVFRVSRPPVSRSLNNTFPSASGGAGGGSLSNIASQEPLLTFPFLFCYDPFTKFLFTARPPRLSEFRSFDLFIPFFIYENAYYFRSARESGLSAACLVPHQGGAGLRPPGCCCTLFLFFPAGLRGRKERKEKKVAQLM